jgi:hypothetical protein
MGTEPATIVALRVHRNAVSQRLMAVNRLVLSLFDLTATFTFEMAKELTQHRGQVDEYPGNIQMQVIHADFFSALISDPITASNIVHELKQIRTMSMKFFPIVPDDQVNNEPSLVGWTDEEIALVIDTYKQHINTATHHLRDINTHYKYLTRASSRMPAFIKSTLMDMFGKADHLPSFTYTDADFQYQRDLPRPNKPQVMTAKWLAPFISIDKACLVEEAIRLIGAHSRPRDNEPETIDFFSSHSSNAIDILG